MFPKKSFLFVTLSLLVFSIIFAPRIVSAAYSFSTKFGSFGYFASQPQFSNVHEIAFDSAGNMYVADIGNHRIQKLTASGVYISSFGSSGSGTGQFSSPYDVEIDSVGNIYVVDYGNDRIQKFNSSGAYVSSIGSSGSGPVQFNQPQFLTFDSSGNMYVVDSGNNRVQKLDSSGGFISEFAIGFDPAGIAVKSTGDIYISYVFAGIKKYNSAGVLQGSLSGSYDHTYGIGFAASGKLYATDGDNYRVHVYNTSDTEISIFGGVYGSGDGELASPRGVAFDASGNIFIIDTDNAKINKFNSSEVYVSSFGEVGSGLPAPAESKFSSPTSAAVDTSGNVYIADSGNDRIQKFDSDGNFLLQFGSFGSANTAIIGDKPGKFSFPSDVTVDSSGNIYVADEENKRVQKFNSSGAFLAQIGSEGSTAGLFTTPSSVAVDSSGNLFVGDRGRHKIIKFNSGGSYVSEYGSLGSGPGQFNYLFDISIDASDNVYAVDQSNQRIQKFNSSGTFVWQTGSSGTTTGKFTTPRSVAIDATGSVLVTDAGNNRVQKFNSSGVYVSSFGTAGTGDGQFSGPWGIAANSTGNIFVLDAGNNRVQRFIDDAVYPLPVSVSATTTASTAVITWNTASAATSRISFGLTSAYSSSTSETDTSPLVTSHSVTLTGLPSCTRFTYVVNGRSSSLIYATSSAANFETSGCTGESDIESTVQQVIATSTGGTMTDNELSLVVPTGFTSGTTSVVFQIRKLDAVDFFAAASRPTGRVSVGDDVFNLKAVTDTSTVISSFDQGLTVTLSYQPSELGTTPESSLVIYRYDGSSWYPLTGCVVDTGAHTVSCQTTHFSDFAIFGTTPASSSGAGSTETGGTQTAGGGVSYGCSDPLAKNYTAFVRNLASLCQYDRALVATLGTTTSTSQVDLSRQIFSRDLSLGSKGEDVKRLQQVLNTLGFQISSTGPGSPGNETDFFGSKTKAAVSAYQVKKGILPTAGFFGPKTRGSFR